MLPKKELLIESVDVDKITPNPHQCKVDILRLDLIDDEVSGNKWFKLKYNLQEAKRRNIPLLTFGGAYSNHIAATAAAGKKFDIETIGVIRGEEPKSNSTLSKAAADGMQLHYVSRSQYRDKYEASFLQNLQSEFGNFYLIPEGGSNKLALKGVGEMLSEQTKEHDYILLASGTGGTTAGIYFTKEKEQQLVSVPVLKNASWMKEHVEQLLSNSIDGNLHFALQYHFGGYAKITNELVNFSKQVRQEFNLPLDYIYTAKAFYGLIDMLSLKYFTPNAKILFIHTGGLQGNKGFDKMIKT